METALILPMLVVLAVGTGDLGRVFHYREAVTNATRQALRVAETGSQHATGDHACAGTSGSTSATLTVHIPYQSGVDDAQMAGIATSVALESSGNGTAATSAIAGAATTVSVTWHCLSGAAVTNSTDAGVTDPTSLRSDSIEAKVTYRFTPWTPLVDSLLKIAGGASIVISSDFTARAEY